MSLLLRASLVVCCVTALAGCSGSGADRPQMATVTGTVTLDGTPLAQGTIVADPADGTGLPAQGGVVDGKFSFEATPGKKTVRVTATQETGEKDQYGEPISKEVIPSKYNAESTLTETVGAVGETTTWAFELKTE
ncbi:MAG: hypothetical protein R3B90_05980 [Planctomycetaceae bacterium]